MSINKLKYKLWYIMNTASQPKEGIARLSSMDESPEFSQKNAKDEKEYILYNTFNMKF